jgi:predicted cupin superfamily sugar epimerase
MHARASRLIETLGLRPHPEGGFYREIFRSSLEVMLDDQRGARNALTTIYYLLPAGHHSRWHQVSSDEIWHFYEGGPLELLELDASGSAPVRHVLGAQSDEQTRVHTVRAGNWQAARPLGEFALVGCTVGPGFDFADFQLLADDPKHASLVRASWPDLAVLI